MEPTSSVWIPYPDTNSIDDIFNDFSGRHAALIRALTHDIDQLYESCSPGENKLCLFGYPDGSWRVSLPSELVPTATPEPTLGINLLRDSMERKDWITMVALHSDAWLIAVAFSLGTALTQTDRSKLFRLINNVPNVYESVRDWKGPANDNPRKDYSSEASGSKSKSSGKRPSDGLLFKSAEKMVEEWHEQNEDDNGKDECGHCGRLYHEDEFWIACDFCDLWYHGSCVGVTSEMAERIGKYECPSCHMKRNKPSSSKAYRS